MQNLPKRFPLKHSPGLVCSSLSEGNQELPFLFLSCDCLHKPVHVEWVLPFKLSLSENYLQTRLPYAQADAAQRDMQQSGKAEDLYYSPAWLFHCRLQSVGSSRQERNLLGIGATQQTPMVVPHKISQKHR